MLNADTLRVRKLEQFDELLGDSSLALNEFEEAMTV